MNTKEKIAYLRSGRMRNLTTFWKSFHESFEKAIWGRRTLKEKLLHLLHSKFLCIMGLHNYQWKRIFFSGIEGKPDEDTTPRKTCTWCGKKSPNDDYQQWLNQNSQWFK